MRQRLNGATIRRAVHPVPLNLKEKEKGKKGRKEGRKEGRKREERGN
jgi:hypothetical protein